MKHTLHLWSTVFVLGAALCACHSQAPKETVPEPPKANESSDAVPSANEGEKPAEPQDSVVPETSADPVAPVENEANKADAADNIPQPQAEPDDILDEAAIRKYNIDEDIEEENEEDIEISDSLEVDCAEPYSGCEKPGLICKNNTWVFRSAELIAKIEGEEQWWSDKKEIYCGGVRISTIVNRPERFLDYRCRYNHWVCFKDDGCDCFNGKEKGRIGFGEICENEVASCKNVPLPPNRYHKQFFEKYNTGNNVINNHLEYKEQEDNASVCLEGNCPCGDGACMQYGVCKKGQCSCDTFVSNQYGEFFCDVYLRDYNDATFTTDETGAVIRCLKPEGCHTLDGRHYPQWATFGFSGEVDYRYYVPPRLSYRTGGYVEQEPAANLKEQIVIDRANREAMLFHIDAGFDMMEESISELGECVLDRTDNIPRMSLAQGADVFVCDQKTCTCDKGNCSLGEICEHGVCRKDDCRAHDKTKAICEVNLLDGKQNVTNPVDPNLCIDLEDKENSNTTIEYGDWGLLFMEYGWHSNPRFAKAGKEWFEAYGSQIHSYPGKMFYDTVACRGGHRYCHGKNNAPLMMPEDDSYLCKDVTHLPNIETKDGLKAWVCDKDGGCKCGENTCAFEQACVDGQCISDVLPVKLCMGKPLMPGYRCQMWIRDTDHLVREIGQYCDRESCACGDSVCPRDTMCRDNRCLYSFVYPYPIPEILDADGKPVIKNIEASFVTSGKNIKLEDAREELIQNRAREKRPENMVPCYGDATLKESGCWCGDKQLSDPVRQTCYHDGTDSIILCNDPEGCVCGQTRCPMSTYCHENQCVDPLTQQPIPQTASKLEPAAACMDSSCACGSKTCSQGQFCIGNVCLNHVYANIKHGQRILYLLDMPSVGKAESLYESPDTSRIVFDSYAWDMIQSMEFESPVAGYAVLPKYEIVLYGGFSEKVLTADSRACAVADGCVCGKTKCPYGSECIGGKCYQDAFIEIFCGEKHTPKDKITLKNAMCYCHNQARPMMPYAGYVCGEKGWSRPE